MTVRTDTADLFRTHRNEYALDVRGYCAESRATQEEMRLRTDADSEELETLGEEHHLLYREFCDRVGRSGEFTGDAVFAGMGDMLGIRITVWERMGDDDDDDDDDDDIERIRYHGYGPLDAAQVSVAQ